MSTKLLEFVVAPLGNYRWMPAPGEELIDPVRKRSLVNISAPNEGKDTMKVAVYRRKDMTIFAVGEAWFTWRLSDGSYIQSRGLAEFSGGRNSKE